jgi:galactokinase
MEYKIKDLCNKLNFGVYKFYKLKDILDNSIPEQNRIEYYYNKGRNFYITEKGFDWFKNNNKNTNIQQNFTNNDINIYQNQIIEIYKQRIEYLETENKRLLDIISVKEQRELAKDVKILGTNENNSFFSRIVDKFKHKQ